MSQQQHIAKHLQRHGTITPLQALNKYGCMRLAARIEELRAKGHKIETEMIEIESAYGGMKRYAKYRYHA